jgi:3-oxoacyl-[acyl-carrier protein] reductase
LGAHPPPPRPGNSPTFNSPQPFFKLPTLTTLLNSHSNQPTYSTSGEKLFPMAELSGRIALVTGASRGIGKAIALALAHAGADVAVNFNNQSEAAESVCQQIRAAGRKSVAIQADVSKSEDVDRMMKTVEDTLGPVAILVNNAGIAKMLPPDEVTEQIFEHFLRVNLTSIFLVTQRVLPNMRAARWGRIINLSSIAAQQGGIIGPHYAASKAGILGLTHSYAALFAKDGITANAIAPGLIDTDMAAGVPKEVRDKVPPETWGSAEEVARIAVLLAENKTITGQTYNINAGRYMT